MWSLTRFCSRVADLTLTASKVMQVRPALNPKLCNQFTFSSCMAVWRSVAIQLEPHLLFPTRILAMTRTVDMMFTCTSTAGRKG